MERALEMTRRQAALPRYIRERHTTKVTTDNLLRASLLPWRKPTGGNPRYRLHASIGLSDMHPDRHQDVVEKQPVSLVGMPEGGQQQAPEAGNRDVVDAHAGLIAQIANWRRVGVVCDRVQRRTRQIEGQSVIGLVDEPPGFSFQVMETTLASPHVAHGRSSAILPVFPFWTSAEVQTDEKRIFLLNRIAHLRQRILASNLCNCYIRCA